MTLEDILGHRVPLAVVAALLIQAGTIIWWASGRDSDLHFMHERLTRIEETVAQEKEVQSQTLERLARIDERLNAIAQTLEHIDKSMQARAR